MKKKEKRNTLIALAALIIITIIVISPMLFMKQGFVVIDSNTVSFERHDLVLEITLRTDVDSVIDNIRIGNGTKLNDIVFETNPDDVDELKVQLNKGLNDLDFTFTDEDIWWGNQTYWRMYFDWSTDDKSDSLLLALNLQTDVRYLVNP
ncbi:MAG: hypothetical protein ACXAD7_11655 [Candidatus Kariarchaeaceae archaeon]